MRSIGLVTFCATTCVLVPAALHHLTAGQEQINKLGDPDLDSFTLGSAKISVALDRHILDPGESLGIRIAVASAPAGTMELGVLVLGANGSEGDRVQTPPTGVAFKTIKLQVKDGVAQTMLAVPLKGAAANSYEPFGHYQVLVGPKAAIAKLDRLRKSSHLVGEAREEIPSLNNAGSQFFSAYWAISSDGPRYDDDGEEVKDSPFTADKIARVDAHVRPKSDAIALVIPPTSYTGDGFIATVTLTNPSRRAMTGLEVKLQEHMGFGSAAYDASPHLQIAPELETITLAAGETKNVQFRVSGDAVGVFGLHAQASCNYEQAEAKHCRDIQALQLGAFDATEVKDAKDKKPTVTAALAPASK